MAILLKLPTEHDAKTRQGDLAQAAQIGCKTLIQLSYDEDFYRDIEELAYLQQTNFKDFASITGEVDHYVNHFLEFEEQIICESKINVVMAKILRNEAEKLREAVRDTYLDVQAVRAHVTRLQEITCNIATSLLKRHIDETEKKKVKNKLLQVSIGLGGAVVLGVNLSVADKSPGGAAASGALGAELISVSVSKILA